MHNFVKTTLAAAALLGLVVSSAAAQTATVVNMIDALRNEVLRRDAGAPGNEGRLLFHSEVGSLATSEFRTDHLVQEWGGGIMTVAGFCDNNCADLDLAVLDENDNVIVQDAATDAHPTVTFRPDAAHVYRLKVTMFRCNTADRCFYSVGEFWRGAEEAK